MDKNTIIKVTNRSNSQVGYKIPDFGDNFSRQFIPGETKEITFDELQKLSYVRGGQYILDNCLVIHNEEAIKALINGVEPEYYYSEKEIKALLESGSIDELLDALDFAPEGVIEMIKRIAVDIRLNDIRKRDAIFEKTGFNINKAIEIEKGLDAEEAETKKEEAPKRRVAKEIKTEKEDTGTRRTAPPKYNIVE